MQSVSFGTQRALAALAEARVDHEDGGLVIGRDAQVHDQRHLAARDEAEALDRRVAPEVVDLAELHVSRVRVVGLRRARRLLVVVDRAGRRRAGVGCRSPRGTRGSSARPSSGCSAVGVSCRWRCWTEPSRSDSTPSLSRDLARPPPAALLALVSVSSDWKGLRGCDSVDVADRHRLLARELERGDASSPTGAGPGRRTARCRPRPPPERMAHRRDHEQEQAPARSRRRARRLSRRSSQTSARSP